MKKLTALYVFLFMCFSPAVLAADKDAAPVAADDAEIQKAEQIIEMTENKVILNIQKQPLNENSSQRIILKKNWFIVNVQVNGKVKIQPLKATYEVE